MQKITIIGNLTADPELKTTTSGTTVCTFTIAVNRRNNKDTDYFRINAWTGLGETCAKYLAKGRKVYVDGELQVHTYEAKNGKTQVSLDVKADAIEFLTPRDRPQVEEEWKDINPNDLPF